MAFIPGPDPTYARIYDGKWLSDSPYNVIMHHVLSGYGFVHCGAILLSDGDPREAYQMDR